MPRVPMDKVVETTPITVKSRENEYKLPYQMCIVIHRLREMMKEENIVEINLDEDGNLEMNHRSLNHYTAKLF